MFSVKPYPPRVGAARIEPMDTPKPSGTGKALAALLGIPIAAVATLFVSIPAEESGRTVKATVQADGSIAMQHIAGKQYLRAYLDMVGVATACDGITKGIRIGMTFTPAQCAAMLERELIAHAKPIITCVPKLYGRTHQVLPAIGLSYNIGAAGVCKSSIAKLWNAGQWRAGCDRFPLFNKAGGNAAWARKRMALGETCEPASGGRFRCTVKGLTARRARERAECLKGL